MLAKIKNLVQDIQVSRCKKKFDKKLFIQKNPYKQWIKETEGLNRDWALKDTPEEIKGTCGKSAGFRYEVIPMYEFSSKLAEKFTENFAGNKSLSSDIIIFVESKGYLTKHAIRTLCNAFKEHDDTSLVYGDEDCISLFGRVAPWFKPDFSPDTLMSFNYFGSVFAVRTREIKSFLQPVSEDYQVSIYNLLLKVTHHVMSDSCPSITNTQRIKHLPFILFHKWLLQEDLASIMEDEEELDVEGLEKKLTTDQTIPGTQEKFVEIKKEACKERNCKVDFIKDQQGFYHAVYEVHDNPLVSIIIPSKDNSEILEKCIRSIRTLSTYPSIEIIVIDNGSTGYQRAILTQLARTLEFEYIYEPMKFNFSKMCNRGVSEAKGEYILLLNDDVEVIQEDFLERMIGQASLSHVGAVGAKLLYPYNQGIQHVGVTNMEVGPAHKLVGFGDDVSYYYGRNKVTYDMIAVTAACLLIKKDKYLKVKGLQESLEVAYNDVDFCFRLYEQGFYNVQRNDVIMYHYESFSRGHDDLDEAKWDRLLMEKEKLYSFHEELRNKDPFYNKNLISNSPTYGCNYHYDFEGVGSNIVTPVRKGKILEEWINECLHIQIDDASQEKKMDLYKENNRYLVEGWSYIQGMDHARYKIELVLKEKEKATIYTCKTLKRVRMDVVAILPQEKNTELVGFVARIKHASLEVGNYQIGVLAKDQCSRQQLLNWTDSYLLVTK